MTRNATTIMATEDNGKEVLAISGVERRACPPNIEAMHYIVLRLLLLVSGVGVMRPGLCSAGCEEHTERGGGGIRFRGTT